MRDADITAIKLRINKVTPTPTPEKTVTIHVYEFIVKKEYTYNDTKKNNRE